MKLIDFGSLGWHFLTSTFSHVGATPSIRDSEIEMISIGASIRHHFTRSWLFQTSVY